MRPLIAVLVVWLAALQAHAAVIADLSLAEVIARADTVVIGTVTTKHVSDQAEGIVTDTTIKVEQVLAGSAGTNFIVSQLGGTIGERTVDVPGDAHLTIGERVVVMTRARPSGRNILVAMGLGVYHLDGREAHQRIDATLMRRDGSVSSGATERMVPLADIIRVARSMRAAER
jgi:hypothetical protein